MRLKPLQRESKIKRTFMILFNILMTAVVALVTIETFLVAANFQDFMFMVRRKDIMSAARRVEQEEQKLIEQKIKEIKKDSLKKIMSPISVNNSK